MKDFSNISPLEFNESLHKISPRLRKDYINDYMTYLYINYGEYLDKYNTDKELFEIISNLDNNTDEDITKHIINYILDRVDFQRFKQIIKNEDDYDKLAIEAYKRNYITPTTFKTYIDSIYDDKKEKEIINFIENRNIDDNTITECIILGNVLFDKMDFSNLIKICLNRKLYKIIHYITDNFKFKSV